MITKTEKAPSKRRHVGRVKWYNVKLGYGFITRIDDGQDVFVARGAIIKWNPSHRVPSLEEGEVVEFRLGGATTLKALYVTGAKEAAVHGSRYAPTRRLPTDNKTTTKRMKPDQALSRSEPETALGVLPFQGDVTKHGPGNGHPLLPPGKGQRIPPCPSSSAKPAPRPPPSV